MPEPLSASVSILNAKTLMALSLTFACETTEFLPQYQMYKNLDKRDDTYLAAGNFANRAAERHGTCKEIPANTHVEVISFDENDPRIMKIRIEGKERYTLTEDFGDLSNKPKKEVGILDPKRLEAIRRGVDIWKKNGWLPGTVYTAPTDE